VMAEGQERPLEDPQMFQSERIDLRDEIRSLFRHNHPPLHAAAANGQTTLRRGSSTKNLPGVDATFREWKSLDRRRRGTFPRAKQCIPRPTIAPAGGRP
jgi:hypothetical protein